MEKKYLKIEEVAKITGLTKRALRYYEDIQLIEPLRTSSGYRLYSDTDIEKINRIRDLKDSLGFSLNDIKSVLDLENELKNILCDNNSNSHDIEKVKKGVVEKIDLIQSKEKTLERVKQKYIEILTKLNNFQSSLKEDNK